MSDQIVTAAASLTAISIVAFAMLRGWHGWLTLKEHELDRATSGKAPEREVDTGSALGAARIELSDLKERIKKLEAIASGVDP
ncbi:hypothetical protein [Tsuneonella dongtanensis]|nr:hypothetical protein [Tsuneonella dongtanensis]